MGRSTFARRAGIRARRDRREDGIPDSLWGVPEDRHLEHAIQAHHATKREC